MTEAIVREDEQLAWDANSAVARPRYANTEMRNEDDYFDTNMNSDYGQYEAQDDIYDTTMINKDEYPMGRQQHSSTPMNICEPSLAKS